MQLSDHEVLIHSTVDFSSLGTFKRERKREREGGGEECTLIKLLSATNVGQIALFFCSFTRLYLV